MLSSETFLWIQFGTTAKIVEKTGVGTSRLQKLKAYFELKFRKLIQTMSYHDNLFAKNIGSINSTTSPINKTWSSVSVGTMPETQMLEKITKVCEVISGKSFLRKVLWPIFDGLLDESI